MMSLLSEIEGHLGADPRLVVGQASDLVAHDVFTAIKLHVAPAQKLTPEELRELFDSLLPMAPESKEYSSGSKFSPSWGSLVFEEVVAVQTTDRDFFVDDVVKNGETLATGKHTVQTQKLVRRIKVVLHESPSASGAWCYFEAAA